MKIINIKKINNLSRTKNRTGFAMLFAVLTASLLLTIGISIFSISLKELIISTNTRESQIAFFAADSARECALYWDIKVGSFRACLDPYGCNTKTSATGTPKCNGISSTTTEDVFPGGLITHTSPSFFKYSSSTSLEPEADITITKVFFDGNITTTISAKGHNTGIKGKRLERAIEQTSTN